MRPRPWLILALTVALTSPVHAGDSWVGQRVMARKSKVQFGDYGPDGKQVYFEMKRVVHRVLKDQEGWLRIHAPGEEGWVDKADMVLVRDAPAFYTTFIRQNPKNTWAWNHRALAWFEKRELDNAIKDYGEYLRLEPDSAVAYHNRGIAWHAKTEYDKAIADYNEAIRLDSRIVNAFNSRGEAWRFQEKYDKAIVDYSEAIRLDPKYVWPHDNRGKAFHAKKEYAKALADFDEAVRLDPKYAYGLAKKAYLLATCPDDTIRNGKKAVELAREACELTSWKNGWFVGVLGAAHAELGQFDEAIRWEQKGLEDPNYAANSDGPDEPAIARERLKAYAQKKPWRE